MLSSYRWLRGGNRACSTRAIRLARSCNDEAIQDHHQRLWPRGDRPGGSERQASENRYGATGTCSGFLTVSTALAQRHDQAGADCARQWGGRDWQNRAGGAVCAAAGPGRPLPVESLRCLVYPASTWTTLRYGRSYIGHPVNPPPARDVPSPGVLCVPGRATKW